MMPNHVTRRLDQLRAQRVRARQLIAQSDLIRDPIDRRQHHERRAEFLRGTEREYAELRALLGLPTVHSIRLHTPAAVRAPLTPHTASVVKHIDTKLTIRFIDTAQRVIEGIATAGSTDLVGDVVEPSGARYDLPIPLLLGHDHTAPVGSVVAARPTSNGIEIRAEIARVDEPGEVKNLVDKAWHLVKHKLIRSLSIGFKPLKAEPLEGGRGMRFLEYRWLELSLVVVPAQPEARITATRAA